MLEIKQVVGHCAEWERFVEAAPGASNYHRLGWREVIERSFGHPTYYLSAWENGELQGILPLVHMQSRLFGSFLVSLPFFNYGGLVTVSDSVRTPLLKEAQRIRDSKGAEYLELRHFQENAVDLPGKNHKVTMLLELKAHEESQWKALDAKVRNQIRKAMKMDLTSRCGGEELLEDFYDVFSQNMRDLGTPVYGEEFFRQVLKCLPDSTRIITVFSEEGQALASALITWFRGRVEIPWASSLRRFNYLCPNNLLYWEAIRQSIQLGAGLFDFGRSTPGEGTWRFKKQWGAQEVPLCWQYMMAEERPLPELNPDNPRYKVAIRLWQHLPVGLTRVLGPSIVRNIP